MNDFQKALLDILEDIKIELISTYDKQQIQKRIDELKKEKTS